MQGRNQRSGGPGKGRSVLPERSGHYHGGRPCRSGCPIRRFSLICRGLCGRSGSRPSVLLLRASEVDSRGGRTKTVKAPAITIVRPIIISHDGNGRPAYASGLPSHGLSYILGHLWSRGTVSWSVSFGHAFIVGLAILVFLLTGATSTIAVTSCWAVLSPLAVLAGRIPYGDVGHGRASLSTRAAIITRGQSRERPITGEKRTAHRRVTPVQIATENGVAALVTAPIFPRHYRAAINHGRPAGRLASLERWYGRDRAAINVVSAPPPKIQHLKGRCGLKPIKQQVSIMRGYFYPGKSG